MLAFPEPGKRLIFIHNPKAAGTSVGEAVGALRANEPGGKYRRHTPWSMIDERDKGLPSLGFVRNPWDRTWSMYRWFCAHMDHSGRTMLSFEDWLKREEMPWVAWLPRGRLEKRPWLRKLHSLTQLWWLEGVQEVGRYENLQADLERIARVLDFPLKPLEWINPSRPGRPYQEAYTSEMRRLVGEMFAQDIERWGYSF